MKCSNNRNEKIVPKWELNHLKKKTLLEFRTEFIYLYCYA